MQGRSLRREKREKKNVFPKKRGIQPIKRGGGTVNTRVTERTLPYPPGGRRETKVEKRWDQGEIELWGTVGKQSSGKARRKKVEGMRPK